MIFFGNSFTLASGASEASEMNGIPGLVQQIAKAAGFPEPLVQKSAVGGKTLEWHLANKTQDITVPPQLTSLGTLHKPYKWDYVILQEYSTRPTRITSYNVCYTKLLRIIRAGMLVPSPTKSPSAIAAVTKPAF